MEFPLLDTFVSVQYTAAKIREVRHDAYHFLGNQRQTRRRTAASGQKWKLRYQGLNGAEVNRLRTFYETAGGDTFSFLDPWTELSHDNCRLALSPLRVEASEPGKFRAELEVEDAVE